MFCLTPFTYVFPHASDRAGGGGIPRKRWALRRIGISQEMYSMIYIYIYIYILVFYLVWLLFYVITFPCLLSFHASFLFCQPADWQPPREDGQGGGLLAPTSSLGAVAVRRRFKLSTLRVPRKGTNGVSTDGVTANFMFLTEGLFGHSR